MSFSGPLQLSAQAINTTNATKQHPLGTKAETPDGRTYRYARAGGVALVAGNLQVAPTVTPNHVNIVVAAAAAIGATTVTATLGATLAAVNFYSEGYMVVNDAVGEGISYKIVGHPAVASAGVITLTLAEPLIVALTVASEISLVQNPYDLVVISVTDQLDQPVGVATTAVPINDYCWLQTGGICSVLADEAFAIAQSLTIGTGLAGAVEANDAAGEMEVGIANQAAADTENRAVFLTMD